MEGIYSIGAGGFGRGILNHIKYNLERKYGNPGRGGVRLHLIDGPREDQYVLPGGYQIDTSDRSKEFFQLSLSPAGVIATISRGGYVPYISDWLSQQKAQQIPNQSSINPRAGGGGSRATGRAIFFLHAHDLRGALREGLSEAVGYMSGSGQETETRAGSGQAIAIIKFSAVGAMGAGMGLDVAHLIKSIKGEEATLVGVMALPNSYDAVIGDPAGRRKRDAKSMALLRELIRFQHADDFLTKISYTHSIGVENDQLFGLCFLIDGEATNLSLNDVHPKYGVCAAVGDLETALALDDRHIIPDLPNWVTSIIGTAEKERRFCAFGVHSYIFPRLDLMETFAFRFAREICAMLITSTEESAEEGRQLADRLLGGYSFTRLGLRLSKDETLPLEPPMDEQKRRQLTELIDSFTLESSEAGSFPSGISAGRIMQLGEIVKTKSHWLVAVSNQQVIQGCQNTANTYIGRPEDKSGKATVWGWINKQLEHIVEELEEKLASDVKGIFYDLRNNRPLQLSDKPYVLPVARDYLLRMREVVGLLEGRLKETYNRWMDDEVVIEQQRRKVEKLEQDMASSGKNPQLQKDYIREYQQLMELEIWGMVAKSCADLASRLRSITDMWWREIGKPAQSWYGLLEDDVEHLSNQLSDLLSVRTDMARVKVRRYFPSPGDAAEQAIYDATVGQRNCHSEFLRQMNFVISAPEQEKPDERSQQGRVYKLHLECPKVEGYDPKVDSRRMYNIIRDRYTSLKVEDHSPYKLVQYGRNFLKPLLDEVHLQEAMLYDYKHCCQKGEGGPKAYATGLASELSEKSHAFLSQRPSGEGSSGGAVLKTFCLGNFRNLPNAEANSADELATLFSHEMERRSGIHPVDGMDDMVICLNFLLGLSIYDWSYYSRCLSQYKEYLRDTDVEPIQIYPEEQNSVELERLLEDEKMLTNGYLSPSVVKYLGDLDNFTSLALSYALGLLEVKQGKMDKPDEYIVKVEMSGSGQVPVSLGPCYQLDKVIANYLAAENEDVQKAVTDGLRHYLTEREKGGGIAEVVQELRSAAQHMHSPATDNSDHDDLHLAIQTVIYRFVKTIEINQHHRVPIVKPSMEARRFQFKNSQLSDMDQPSKSADSQLIGTGGGRNIGIRRMRRDGTFE